MSDYQIAWLVFGLSAGFLMFVVWRLTAFIGLLDLRVVLRVIAAVLLFFPAYIDGSPSYWTPAFIAVLLELVTVSIDAGLARLWPLLAAMLLGVIASLLVTVTQRKRQPG
jgi:hypothetical protein